MRTSIVSVRKLRSLAQRPGPPYDPCPDVDSDPYVIATVSRLGRSERTYEIAEALQELEVAGNASHPIQASCKSAF
jgi:hypothetical protein